MNLIKKKKKRVKIISDNDKNFEGIVSDYCYPEDDENNMEMIIVDVEKGDYAGSPVGFYEKDIKSIEILE